MVYRVYLSATPTSPCDDAIKAVTETITEQDGRFVLVTNDYTPLIDHHDISSTKDVGRMKIKDCDLFIGIYCDTADTPYQMVIEPVLEAEYQAARQYNLPCLLFGQHGTNDSTDERLQTLMNYLTNHQVMHHFGTADELAALVRINLTKFLQNKRSARQQTLKPMTQAFNEMSAPTTTNELDTIIERALELAQDDIEQIVRRALEVHDAHHKTADDSASPGWMNVNPIFGEPLKQSQFEADIFMIMPFRENFDQVYQNVVIPTVQGLNLTIKRGDDFSSISGVIMSEVWAAINACQIVIVETTENNPNVFYELGIAHTLGKPSILITQEKDIEKWPFDIRHMRFIVYEDTIAGGEQLAADLRKQIIWILNDLEDSPSSSTS